MQLHALNKSEDTQDSMASLRDYIVSTFPKADTDAINRMLNQFDSVGIYEPCDIAYIENEAELPEMKPVEARKLLQKVRHDFKTPDTQEVNGQKHQIQKDEEQNKDELNLEIKRSQLRQKKELDLEEIIKAKNKAGEQNARNQREEMQLQMDIMMMESHNRNRKKVISGMAGTALVGAGIVGLACPPAGLAWLAIEVAGFTISATGAAGLAAIGAGGKFIKDAVVEEPVAARMIEATPEVPTGQLESPATGTDEPRLPADGQSTHGQRKKRQ